MLSLAAALTVVGAGILTVSLKPICRLISALPPSRLKRGWYVLASLVATFIVGYVVTAMAEPSLLISLIFLLGAVFVWLVSSLSQHTAHYAGRLAVLERENTTDSLMKIYNRRYLDASLIKEISRSQQKGRSLSVLLLDIDHFKYINDTHGHLCGDAVLKQLGPLLQQSVRKVDMVARYGGEEVVILASNTGSDVASELAERIRSIVSATHFYSFSGNGSINTKMYITVSVGVATLGAGDNMATLVQRADEALYQAKGAGRNRVEVSDQIPVAMPCAVKTTGKFGAEIRQGL